MHLQLDPPHSERDPDSSSKPDFSPGAKPVMVA